MNWQPWIAAGIVIAAAVWIGRQVWTTVRRAIRNQPGQSNCGSCSRNKSKADDKSVVQLQSPTKKS